MRRSARASATMECSRAEREILHIAARKVRNAPTTECAPASNPICKLAAGAAIHSASASKCATGTHVRACMHAPICNAVQDLSSGSTVSTAIAAIFAGSKPLLGTSTATEFASIARSIRPIDSTVAAVESSARKTNTAMQAPVSATKASHIAIDSMRASRATYAENWARNRTVVIQERYPSRSLIAAAARRTPGAMRGIRSSVIRMVGPETLIAPTHAPV